MKCKYTIEHYTDNDYLEFNFTISATLKTKGDKTFHQGGACNTYNVIVESRGEQMEFEFHDSINNYNSGVVRLDKKAMLEALRCYISDSSIYDECGDIDSFAREFCDLNRDGITKIINMFNACKKASDDTNRLFGSEDKYMLDEAIDEYLRNH